VPYLRLTPHRYGKRFPFIAWSMSFEGPIDAEDHNLPTTHHNFFTPHTLVFEHQSKLQKIFLVLMDKLKYQKYHPRTHRHCTNFIVMEIYGSFHSRTPYFVYSLLMWNLLYHHANLLLMWIFHHQALLLFYLWQ